VTTRRFFISLIIPPVLFSLIALSGCSGTAEEPPAVMEEEQDGEEQQEESALDDFEYDPYEGGTDLDGVNLCQLVPVGEVSAIVGPLREDETEEDISLAGEAGCKYYDQEGHFYVLTFYPLMEWGVVEYTLNDAEKVAGLLDGAWMGSYSGGEITLKALAEGEMVIGTHISTGDLDTARQLIELGYQHRP